MTRCLLQIMYCRVVGVKCEGVDVLTALRLWRGKCQNHVTILMVDYYTTGYTEQR